MTSSEASVLATYVVGWLRRRNGAHLERVFARMRFDDYERLVAELEMILAHGGKPPNWVA